MCEDCRHYPCISSCPNYEPLVLAVCDSCGGEIYAGEHYFEIPIEGYPTLTFNICEDCMDSFGKYAEEEDYEPDACDVAKAYEEERMLKDAEF